MSARDYYQQSTTMPEYATTPSGSQFSGGHIGNQYPYQGHQYSQAQSQGGFESAHSQSQPSSLPFESPTYNQKPSTEKGFEKEDYNIGIVCALSKEKAAAECFLDIEHPKLKSQPHGDNNAYTLGSMGPHNVVIACLPEGRYGTVKAANVSRDSEPNSGANSL
jgi:hypothetical protein